jgi:PAS domain S-box-containing protein
MGVVLIAFEREAEQTAVEQLLSGRGHQVHKSNNGLAALDAARREPPDVIVSDIVLPRMDGFALCRKWKQDERLQDIPFVFYTRRHDDPKYERFALELGAARFLARSVAPEALGTAIDELLTSAAPKQAAAAPAPTAAPSFTDSGAFRARAVEEASKRHLEALERAQQAQARLRAQLADLEAQNQRLAASEIRFRRIFEANALPMWIADHETGGFIAVNDAALNLYGYSRSEFLALKADALAVAQADGTNPARHRRRGGAEVPLALSVQEIEFDGRRADLVSAYDLSERVAFERALQENSVSRSAVLDTIGDGVLLIDGEGRILEANAEYCRMSGYARDALLALRVSDIEDPAHYAANGSRYETKHRRDDGTSFDVEVTVGMSDDAERNTVLVVRDVSQRRREQAAQQAAHRQAEFFADLYRHADSSDESAIVRRLIDQALEATGSPLAYLYFVDAKQQALQLAAWRERTHSHATMGSGESFEAAEIAALADCLRAKRVVIGNETAQVAGLPDLRRFLAVPVVSNDETVAILGVANRDHGYLEDDQRTLLTIAQGTWRVLQSKRAQARTLASLQRTDVALQAMIDSFVRVIERHDPYTAGSSRRLAMLAVALGREAGLDGERQHGLRIAALLHDVGNIAVPASILAKPAPLTETEHALMRTHVEEGCQLLAEIDFGAPVADIIYQSHERFDGSGYPRGIKGDDIMLEARILAIADTVEAMCSPRPYRPAASVEAALAEINRAAGRLFDPQLVVACTRLFERGFKLPE